DVAGAVRLVRPGVHGGTCLARPGAGGGAGAARRSRTAGGDFRPGRALPGDVGGGQREAVRPAGAAAPWRRGPAAAARAGPAAFRTAGAALLGRRRAGRLAAADD